MVPSVAAARIGSFRFFCASANLGAMSRHRSYPRHRAAFGELPSTYVSCRKFAAIAAERIRIEGGGYRGHRLRALAQRV